MRAATARLAVLLTLTIASLATGAEPAKPIPLFNGKDLSGWTARFKTEDVKIGDVFTAREGVLHVKGKPGGYIRTDRKYTHYKLKLEWRYPAKPGNSGVLLRIEEPEKVWPTSIEAQLASGKAGDIIDMGPKREHFPRKSASNEKPPGEWNTYEITMDGGDLTLTVNGELQNAATNRRVTAGYIGLQSEGAEIEFRAIELTPLPDPAPASQPSKSK